MRDPSLNNITLHSSLYYNNSPVDERIARPSQNDRTLHFGLYNKTATVIYGGDKRETLLE